MEAEWCTDVELQNAHARCLTKSLCVMRRSVSIHLHGHRCGYHNISLRLPFVRVPVVPDLSASGLVPGTGRCLLWSAWITTHSSSCMCCT